MQGSPFCCIPNGPRRPRESRDIIRPALSGKFNGGVLVATPTGEGSAAIPDHVRVYSEKGKLLTEVETEVVENANWHFEVFLKPGIYTLVAYAGAAPEVGGILYSLPVAVTVGKKEFTEVALSFRLL